MARVKAIHSMSVQPIKVLWLRDNRPGHINKVKGFLSSVADLIPIEVTPFDLQWRWSLLRHLAGRWNRVFLKLPPAIYLRDFHPGSDFDLIISSGGLTQLPSVLMARRLDVPNIYLGSPHHYPPEMFVLIPMTDPPHGESPFIKMELVPSGVTPQSAKDCATRFFPDFGASCWTLLVGGNGEGMKWDETDFLLLADRFIEAAEKAGKSFFVATSRRTPEIVERSLIERFESRPGFAGAAWFHQSSDESPPVLALLGGSERIVVTADSVSMTNEAVASGIPTVVVYPTNGEPKKRCEAQLLVLEEDGKLIRSHLKDSGDIGTLAPPQGWKPVTGNLHLELAEKSLKRLGFLPQE